MVFAEFIKYKKSCLKVMSMGDYLEYASASSQSRDSYQAGVEAAEKAISQIKKYKPTLVVVFASVSHEIDRCLQGINKVLSDVPMVGCSTAGEFCGKLLSGSVVVTILASPFMDVKVGFGQAVSKDYTTSLHEMITTGHVSEFFNALEPGLEEDYTKKSFALLFVPGPVKNGPFYGKEVIELIRRRTVGALPVVGGCSGDNCRREQNYQIFNGQLLEDCLVGAFIKTNLKFGIATVHNYRPKENKVTVTKAKDYEILQFNGQPAADFFAGNLDLDFGDFMAQPATYLYKTPFGFKDITGMYHLVPGTGVTPDHGISCLHNIEEGTVLHIMEPSSEKLLESADIFLRKAVLRGRITRPAAAVVFSSTHRVNSMRELIPLSLQKIHKNLKPSINISGICSCGEVGLTDEGIVSLFNMSLSGLIIGDELNEAAMMAQKNLELCSELQEAAQKNRELYQELSVVHDLGNLLNSSLKLGFVINKAVQMVAQLLQSDGCLMFLYDEENATIKTVSSFGFGELPKDLNLQNSLPYRAIKEQKKLLIKKNKNAPIEGECLGSLIGAHSAIISPIIVKKQKVGVVAVYSKQGDFYTGKDLEFLETLVNQIGIAVVNADLYERTELLACTDGLTGLFDHNYFLKTLERLMVKAEEKQQPISLVMVDLDDFKYFNDKYGHTVGDLILKTTAQILRDNVRSEDIIARYGGDEFAVILVNAGQKKANRLAERISQNVANQPFSDPESRNVFYITASIGIATFPFDADTGKELIDAADKAMYLVKRTTKAKAGSYLTEFEELESSLTPSEKALLDTIKLLIQVLDSRDRYTWEHCRQVARYATQIGERMKLPKEAVSKLKLAGYLHDMGKIHVNPEVLNKRGWLNETEMDTIKLHPIVGANLLAPIKGFDEVRKIIYHHHEWFNGNGYPDGLKGEQIPVGSRILAVADGFDAMTSNRPYRKACTYEWAISELKQQTNVIYDPQVVKIFLEILSEKSH